MKMSRRKRNILDDDPNKNDEFPVDEETTDPAPKKGIVCNAPSVRVRKEPSGTSTTLRILERGDEVTILEKITEMYYKVVLADGSVGYISCNYCNPALEEGVGGMHGS